MKRAAILIAVVTIGCYAHLFLSPSTRFVFDDNRFVAQNEAVHHISRAVSYFTDPTTVDPRAWTGIYRPLRTLDFAVDWMIAGPSPAWFHFRNVIYLVIGALLLLFLLRRWGASVPAATLGALLFAVHPVQVEAAGWITSRGDVLCLVFFLLALLLHDLSRGWDRWFAGAAGALVLALLSKEAAVMFPAAVFLVDFFFRDGRRFRVTFARWRKYAVYGLLAAAYFGLWTWLHTSRGAPRWHLQVRWGGSLFGTLLTMSRGFVYYFRLVLFPVDMATDYYITPVKTPDPLTILCALLVLSLIVYAVYRMFRGGGVLAFAVLWFFTTIFPTSNIPAPIGIITAERFLNIPMVGVAAAAGFGLAWLYARGRPGRFAVIALLGCVSVVTFQRTFDWDSDRALWLSTLDRFDSPRALEWRGNDRRERAAELLKRAGALTGEKQKDEADALRKQADALLVDSLHDYNRAIEGWKRLPASGPSVAMVRSNRAFSYFYQGKVDLALSEANELLQKPVWQLIGRSNLLRALCLHEQGHLRAAARAADTALEWENSPGFRKKAAAIYQDLAKWYSTEEHLNLARKYFCLRRSFELYPSPRENRGVQTALAAMDKQFNELVKPLRQAVAARTQNGQVYIDLAVLHAAYGFYDAAEAAFARLMEPDQMGRDPHLLNLYARYFWESRDTLEGYDQAKKVYEDVLAAHPADPKEAKATEEVAKQGIERVARERKSLEESLALDPKPTSRQ